MFTRLASVLRAVVRRPSPRSTPRRLGLEVLEGRTVPDSGLWAQLSASGTLFISGTSGNDWIGVRESWGTLSIDSTRILVDSPWGGILLPSVSADAVTSLIVWGNNGHDSIWLGLGAKPATVYGGTGDDAIWGGGAADVLYGEDGHNYIFGGNGNDQLIGGNGNDSLYGDTGNDFLWGGDGNNLLSGWWGDDTLYGSYWGYDRLFDSTASQVGLGNGWMTGLGNDTFYWIESAHLVGTSGNDVLDATLFNGPVTLNGGDGADTLRGGPWSDYLDGGWGYSGDWLYGNSGNDSLYGYDGDDHLNGGSGSDTLVGGWGNDTLISLDDDIGDALWGEGGVDSFWVDENPVWFWHFTDRLADVDAWESSRSVHRIRSFVNGADRTLDGDRIADPTDGPNYKYFSGRPLFATTGPSENDIHQGSLGDCWLLAGIGALARTSPFAVRQLIVDLGDGTYAVRLGGQYYRVDTDLPTANPWSRSLIYAGFGQGGSLWVPLVEKAYAHFRSGANTYGSLNGGLGVEALRGLNAGGVVDRYFDSYGNGQEILNDVAWRMMTGQAVTLGFDAVAEGCPCIASHEYTVVGLRFDAWGTVTGVILRNPWGNGAGEAVLVTVTADQLFASAGSIAWGAV